MVAWWAASGCGKRLCGWRGMCRVGRRMVGWFRSRCISLGFCLIVAGCFLIVVMGWWVGIVMVLRMCMSLSRLVLVGVWLGGWGWCRRVRVRVNRRLWMRVRLGGMCSF